MATPHGAPVVADAAARWVADAGTSARVRDARRWDLGVVARIVADVSGRSAATSEPHAHLRQLQRLCWDDLDPPLVSGAIATFGADHAPSTERRLLATWSSFLGWLAEEGYPVPSKSEPLLSVLERVSGVSHDDVGTLVAEVIASGRRTRDPWPERDRAMVGVIVAGQLSLETVLRLVVKDVWRKGGTTWLRVRSRQGRVQWVELASPVVEALQEYLASRRAAELARSDPDLFVRVRSGKPYTIEAIRYLYVGWFRRAGVKVPPGSPSVALGPVYEKMFGEF